MRAAALINSTDWPELTPARGSDRASLTHDEFLLPVKQKLVVTNDIVFVPVTAYCFPA